MQLQEKSDTLEKKFGLHSFKYKGMSVCTSYLAADPSYSQTNSWRIYKTELKRTESGISTELCPPNLCDICDTDLHCILIFTKASQGIRTPNNAECTKETVSQMGYNVLLRQKCLFAIMPYYFGQFLK